eukprot:scaffold5882_cov100-Cylindrotheca_fusiformis.AAC.4
MFGLFAGQPGFIKSYPQRMPEWTFDFDRAKPKPIYESIVTEELIRTGNPGNDQCARVKLDGDELFFCHERVTGHQKFLQGVAAVQAL